MTAESWAHQPPFAWTAASAEWNQTAPRSLFGDVALTLFLLTQCFDGVFTYVGVASFGVLIEANPILTALMTTFGHGAALTAAKLIAGLLGICLHLTEAHNAVAVLTGFYVAVAIVPWTAILFF